MRSEYFWFDLMTSDVTAAATFYGAFTNWNTQAFGDYQVVNAGTDGMGGMMAKEATAPSAWIGHVFVADVDASVARAQALGGKVKVPARDIPTVGRFAVLADPQGAAFAVFKPTPPPGATHRPAMSEAQGRMSWAELVTSDWQAALRFYIDLFGWKQLEVMNAGAMGKYATFNFGDDEGAPMGGMMNIPNCPPAWIFYISVDDADRAAQRIPQLGGKITNGPMDVPGGGRAAQCLDPQGAAFGIYSRKR